MWCSIYGHDLDVLLISCRGDESIQITTPHVQPSYLLFINMRVMLLVAKHETLYERSTTFPSSARSSRSTIRSSSARPDGSFAKLPAPIRSGRAYTLRRCRNSAPDANSMLRKSLWYTAPDRNRGRW